MRASTIEIASRVLATVLVFCLTLVTNVQSQEATLPPGFARLKEVARGIRQDMRYAGAFNFTGKPVPGYELPECILWRPAAEALGRAQERLAPQGFHLKVYDCYRPSRAVRAFVTWSRASGEDRLKHVFYPELEKSRLFALGYIAERSKHSLGIAVDIGLVRADETDPAAPADAGRCDGPFEQRARESSLDFGTAYDCFSDRSATRHRSVTGNARENRDRLLQALAAEGFSNYSKEWWHFEFHRPDAPARPHDFPVR